MNPQVLEASVTTMAPTPPDHRQRAVITFHAAATPERVGAVREVLPLSLQPVFDRHLEDVDARVGVPFTIADSVAARGR
ncbi:hypothetical protein [Rhodococcus qingshengii]|uniref:hypothetical protein n=1 Tax=Rhodococcus qingshengii TaxID=334542 RepID=UPI0021B105F2|nr:hypothetical protein [Rhodococcus qingshengii]MCT6735466.1 hypothetical protein [Rhodococcus qingshengii]